MKNDKQRQQAGANSTQIQAGTVIIVTGNNHCPESFGNSVDAPNAHPALRECTITIVRKDNNLLISDDSLETLKSIFRNGLKNKDRNPIQVKLDAPNIPDLSKALLRRPSLGILDKNAAMVADQDFRINYQSNKEIIETAVRFLLQDESLYITPHSLEIQYPQLRNPVSGFFVDSDKIVHSYSVVFLWKHVLEKMLNSLLLGRFHEYMNSNSLYAVDGFVEGVCSSQTWYFTSFISSASQNKTQNMDCRLKFRDCDYLDFADADKLDYILPDFYIALARLNHRDAEKYKKYTQDSKSILDMLQYRFGFH